jgi:hypothetical protein
MDTVRLDTLMRDNLVYLVIFISIFFLYVYTDVIVDITPQNSFVFVPKSRSPIPKGHFRHRISKSEIHICL